ncbi:MAG: ubiquinol-cytochrome c reductase iron-sulfur subunit [Gammaproteobacteria bacterium]|jgi:ubiquinol-cytochrome c reductase iron-sulfur subunit|nr:ubiquinol-cytochrome c reductase iron-sulfur subunit [Gammaproteobacteria bacterium]
MSETAVDLDRRRFLTGTAAVIGGIGAATAAVPFIASFQPSAKAKAIGAPVEADISAIEPGQRVTYKWRGKPVWVMRRTPEQIDALKAGGPLRDPESIESEQPEFAKNAWRSSKPEYLVLVGICTHLGCSPSFRPVPDAETGADWKGGFYCPCHGSKFDLAGRVYAGVPAPLNMVVPPYKYLTDTRILIGEMEGSA